MAGPAGPAGPTGPTGPAGTALIADPPCFDDVNRYADCGNGTVTDQFTGLIWLKNVGCNSGQRFAAGNNFAKLLAAGQCGLADNSSPGDWRLPTSAEWLATVKLSCPSPSLSDTTGAGCFAAGSPFTNMPGTATRRFKSSTVDRSNPANYTVMDLDTGTTLSSARAFDAWGNWPVRSRR